MIDRRAVFFIAAAALSALLIPIVPDDPAHPWLGRVGWVLVAGLVVLAIVSWLDHWSRDRARR